ncbi:hypothetical protein CAPTEDRAFT_167181 [Capitella teleta]|uniref:Cas1p 10 TM acyl transferase domain-containing protein n=1 Tax=Capitella teleta TaxID=283909 RepID=R7UB72_CAPTE|nr:hypothetical protein CAPTEDRAFT_167181 [Capitella teleta]|eukprot:ELU01043.1 hypothetical protein CAPTEDRAFT_167181 [Capitella teleta]
MKSNLISPEFLKYVTIDVGKIIAFGLVLLAIGYHTVLHSLYGQNSCQWLLTDGHSAGNGSWQPYGCMMHTYKQKDSVTCAKYIAQWSERLHVVFVGDSRIRQLYFRTVNSLSDEPTEAFKAHSDLLYEHPSGSAVVEFLWQPIVNGSMLNAINSLSERSIRPTMVIAGCATVGINPANCALSNLYLFSPSLIDLSASSKVIWMLQDPVDEEAMWESRRMITNQQVDQYNVAAQRTLSGSSIHIWSSSKQLAQKYTKQSQDGLHMPDVVLSLDIQLLWNLLCNEHLQFRDGQCCTRPEAVSNLQLFTAAFFFLWFHIYLPIHSILIAAPLWLLTRETKKPSLDLEKAAVDAKAAPNLKKDALVALAKLGLIMTYFFLADRNNYFMKTNKHYSHLHFFLAFIYFVFLGLFFSEKSKQTKVLHRDQTDEWKGWMQIVILIYHYTGASQVLPIYMQVRVLVSTYLFTSGFGHFCFFWNKADYSIHRFCMVMFRMNFLVIVLCFVMNRPYQFYYFVPLVSFWFLVIYSTMAMWPRVSAATQGAYSSGGVLYMLLKFFLLVAIITLFYASEVLFEQVFLTQPIQSLFVSADSSIHEWRFRWQLDRFSTIYGMVFGLFFILGQKVKLWDDSGDAGLFSVPVNAAVGFVALIGFIGYSVFASTCESKPSCNHIHSYIAFIPIVCYILLRNLPGWLRVRYSTLFAWFGRISLELFIGQYHIWLAADTQGLLVLIPSSPGLNTLLCSFIFVCIAHEIHCITGVLAPILVPSDLKLLLRNCVVFACVLLPVAISRGVFFA